MLSAKQKTPVSCFSISIVLILCVMTRTSRTNASNNAPQSGRVSRLNRSRNFKKSSKDSRAPLGSISLNQSKNGSIRRKSNKSNPFASFNPNKSGIILPTEEASEPSDFSHFLSPDGSPPATGSGPNMANQANPAQMNGKSSSNSSSESGGSCRSNVISPQSRSNKNLVLKEKNPSNPSKDDLIFAGLQMFNSMTVPFNAQSTGKQRLSKNTMAPLAKSNGANLSRSNGQREKKNRMTTYKLDYLPMDWCLKRSLYFVSDESLDWCCNIPIKIRNAAMHRVEPHTLNIVESLPFDL